MKLTEKDIDSLIGKFKGKYGKDIKSIKEDPEFKDLADDEKEVVLDELKESFFDYKQGNQMQLEKTYWEKNGWKISIGYLPGLNPPKWEVNLRKPTYPTFGTVSTNSSEEGALKSAETLKNEIIKNELNEDEQHPDKIVTLKDGSKVKMYWANSLGDYVTIPEDELDESIIEVNGKKYKLVESVSIDQIIRKYSNYIENKETDEMAYKKTAGDLGMEVDEIRAIVKKHMNESKLSEIRSLVHIDVYFNGKNSWTLNYPGGSKVFHGTPEGFARFLRQLQAKDSSLPHSIRNQTYLGMVDNIMSAKDPNLYCWSNCLNNLEGMVFTEEYLRNNVNLKEDYSIELVNGPRKGTRGNLSSEPYNKNGTEYVKIRLEQEYEDKEIPFSWVKKINESYSIETQGD